MSETREPLYVVLDYNQDYKLDAHIDSDEQQHFILQGYIQKRKADGLYQAPLIPQLFYGASGQQLDTWGQYLTAGDHTILQRDSGNPFVPDNELMWQKVGGTPAPQRQQPVQQAPVQIIQMDIPVVPILVILGVPIMAYVLYKALK